MQLVQENNDMNIVVFSFVLTLGYATDIADEQFYKYNYHNVQPFMRRSFRPPKATSLPLTINKLKWQLADHIARGTVNRWRIKE